MTIESIAVLIGTLGGFELIKYLVNLFVNRNNNARKADAEADIAETEAETALIHNYEERLKEQRETNKELNAQILTLIKEKARKDEIIDDKVAQIRKVNEELVKATRHIAHMEKELQFYKNWKCFREYGKGKGDCTRREPKQNPPLKYAPLEEEIETD